MAPPSPGPHIACYEALILIDISRRATKLLCRVSTHVERRPARLYQTLRRFQLRTKLLTTVIAGLALAALLGVLLPSDSAVHAADPEFVSGAGSRSVPENTPPGVNIGDPISATDADEGTDGVRPDADLQPRRRRMRRPSTSTLQPGSSSQRPR